MTELADHRQEKPEPMPYEGQDLGAYLTKQRDYLVDALPQLLEAVPNSSALHPDLLRKFGSAIHLLTDASRLSSLGSLVVPDATIKPTEARNVQEGKAIPAEIPTTTSVAEAPIPRAEPNVAPRVLGVAMPDPIYKAPQRPQSVHKKTTLKPPIRPIVPRTQTPRPAAATQSSAPTPPAEKRGQPVAATSPLDQEIAILARHVTLAPRRNSYTSRLPQEAAGLKSSTAPGISDSYRALLETAWPKLDIMERRVTLLLSYYRRTPDQIAPLLYLHPLRVNQILASAQRKISHSTKLQQAHQAATPTTRPAKSPEPLIPNELPVKVIDPETNTNIYWQPVAGTNNSLTGELSDPLQIHRISFGSAVIGVNPASSNPTPQTEKCAVLASLGLSNKDISKLLFISGDTVNTHLQRYFKAHNITNRSELAINFFRTGYYTPLQAGDPLQCSPRVTQVVKLVAEGLNNEEIKAELGIALDTVKTHLRKFSGKYELQGREQIALAVLTRDLNKKEQPLEI